MSRYIYEIDACVDDSTETTTPRNTLTRYKTVNNIPSRLSYDGMFYSFAEAKRAELKRLSDIRDSAIKSIKNLRSLKQSETQSKENPFY